MEQYTTEFSPNKEIVVKKENKFMKSPEKMERGDCIPTEAML